MYLIKNAKVYAPEELGIQDVLIGGSKILKIAKDLPEVDVYDVKVIDGTGKVMFPGLIDAHVHILGGGGEGGYFGGGGGGAGGPSGYLTSGTKGNGGLGGYGGCGGDGGDGCILIYY